MSSFIDLTGQRFGRLTAIRLVERKKFSLWECRCDCGNTTNVWYNNLQQGNTRSCGCYQRERTSKAALKHGESTTRIYKIWAAMLQRCNNPAMKAYHYYGGRGIKVCDEWHDYEMFRAWSRMSGYREGLSIERKDVDGNYCPENCTWIPKNEQTKNRSNTVYVMYRGERCMLSDLTKKAGISRSLMHYRLSHGWSVEAAVETPVRECKNRPSVVETEKAAKEKCAKRIVPQKGLNVKNGYSV